MPKNCPVCHTDCDFELEEVKRADGLTGVRHKPKVEKAPPKTMEELPKQKEPTPLTTEQQNEIEDLLK